MRTAAALPGLPFQKMEWLTAELAWPTEARFTTSIKQALREQRARQGKKMEERKALKMKLSSSDASSLTRKLKKKRDVRPCSVLYDQPAV